MLLYRHLRWILFCVAVLLQACGGGGGSGDRPPVASASLAQSPVAVGAQVFLDGRGSVDPDGGALRYQWRIASAPAHSSAGLSFADGDVAAFTPDRPGSYVFELVVRDAGAASEPARVTLEAVSLADVRIVLDAAEPLAGTVRLALDHPVGGRVDWFVDGNLAGPGAFADNRFDWNTASVANGSHVVVARIQSAAGMQELRRTVEVYNTAIAMEVSTQLLDTRLRIEVSAQSPNGVDTVQATLGGRDLGTLTVPDTGTVYRFTVDRATLASGTYSLVVSAADGIDTRRVSREVVVSNAPVLGVAQPVDGAFVFGSLGVAGAVSSDKTGTVTVTALLRDLTILQTTEPSFGANYSLAGFPSGPTVVAVHAVDRDFATTTVRRSVVVASSSSLAYTPTLVLPAGGRLFDAEGSRLLYQPNVAGALDPVIVRDAASGSEVSLGAIGSNTGTHWQLSGGRAYAEMRADDCPATCIYEWTSDGTRRNLTTANPFYAGLPRALSDFDEHPVARDGYVAWTAWRQLGGFMLYEAASGSYRHIPQPAEMISAGNHSYDLAVVGGVVHFVYWGQTGGSGLNTIADVYHWDSASGASRRLSTDDTGGIYTQTDGIRAAWTRQPATANEGRFTLFARPLAGGSPTVVSTIAREFRLRDGLLAWLDYRENFELVLRASTASGEVATIAAGPGIGLWATGGGYVVYSVHSKVYAWNAATGQSTLKIDTVPQDLRLSGGALVFRINSSIYRVPL